MSTQNDAVNEFLKSQGAKAFSFEKMGDAVSGEIVAMDLRQQTDMETGEPLTWRTGEPRMVLVITITTELQDGETDDGQRTLWCRGGNYQVVSGKGTSSLTAVKDALRRANATDIEVGGVIGMSYTGDGKPSARGMNAPKLYTCVYQPPTRNVSLDDLS